jgi:hypothetical protein
MLPSLPTVDPGEADVAWLIYGLDLDTTSRRYRLVHRRTEYTAFQSVLDRITLPTAGPMTNFMSLLQEKLDEKLGEGHAPDAPGLGEVLSE